MKIAYLITAYKDEKQLARLIEALMCEGTDFYIHIDKKVSDLPFKKEMEQLKHNEENVICFIETPERVRVHWGGYSQIKAQLALIKEMLQSKKNYDWCINLTGTDYPIMSNREIKEFLEKQNGRPVIKGYQLDCMYGTQKEENVKDRIRQYWFFDIEPVLLRKLISKTATILQKLSAESSICSIAAKSQLRSISRLMQATSAAENSPPVFSSTYSRRSLLR